LLSARKFNGRKVFEKIIVGGLFLFFLFQQPTLIGPHSGPLACSPQQMVKNQFSRAFYNGFNSLETYSFGIWGKIFSNQILVEQRKVQLFLEKPCHFSEQKKISKIRNTLWNFEIYFSAILNSCSTNVHSQN
jgi:hypothetical protein